MSAVINIFARFLLFIAVLIIVMLPVSILISGHAINHQHTPVNKSKIAHHQYLERGGHDISWDFFNKRHLSAPPVHFKLKTIAVIFLLFSLFAGSYLLSSANASRFSFLPRKGQFPAIQRHVVYQTFLI